MTSFGKSILPDKTILISELNKRIDIAPPKLNLLTHPLCYFPYDIGLSFLDYMCGQNRPGYLITSAQNIDIVKHKISESITGDIKVADYDDDTFPYLRARGALIVFDSLYMILGNVDNKDNITQFKNLIVKLYENRCTVVFIIDYGFSQEDINKLIPQEEFIDNTMYINFPFGDNLREPVFKNQCKDDSKVMTITNKQEEILKAIKSIELSPNNFFHDIIYYGKIGEENVSYKRFFNIAYPYNVANIISEQDNIDSALQTVIHMFGREELLKDGPKIKRLYDILCLNTCKTDGKGAKHIIFTGYPFDDDKLGLIYGEYGGDIVYNLLTYNPGGSPCYEPNAVIRSYVGDVIENINKFNTDPSIAILILNSMPPVIPKNVNHLHILDTRLDEAFNLIDVLYKPCGSGFPDMDIHLYPINYTNSMSHDSYDFKMFMGFFNKFKQERQERWEFQYAYPNLLRVKSS